MSNYIRSKIITSIVALIVLFLASYYDASLILTFAQMMAQMLALIAAVVLAHQVYEIVKIKQPKPVQAKANQGDAKDASSKSA